jgi:hypothetical protein
VVGTRRLDLRTDETTMAIHDDTPEFLTARGLASVRREAGADRFPDGVAPPGHDDGWNTWAEGLTDTDGRIAELESHLKRRTPRLLGWAGRLLANRRPHGLMGDTD